MRYFQQQANQKQQGLAGGLVTLIFRVGLAILIPIIAFYVLYQGFVFLRAGDAPKWVITVVAIIWGVGGTAALYWIFNWIIEMLPVEWTARLQPFVFVGPAMAILAWYLAFPTVRNPWISFFGRDGPPAIPLGLLFSDPAEYFRILSTSTVGKANSIAVFSDRLMREAITYPDMSVASG